MPRRLSQDKRELCYPFIFDNDPKCDFEVHTDRFCSQVGRARAQLNQLYQTQAWWQGLDQDLVQLQTLIYHLNGSVRGKLALQESDLDWCKARYEHYYQSDKITGFVLPDGCLAVMDLHLCRSDAKKSVRQLVLCEQAEIPFDERLYRFCNLLANLFFCMTVFVKTKTKQIETPFVSLSY